MKSQRRQPRIIDPAARAVLDQQRTALLSTLRAVPDPDARRIFIGALRKTEDLLGVVRAEPGRQRIGPWSDVVE